jgi:hypothetical protein
MEALVNIDLRQIKALEASAGSWEDKDHPELKRGAAKWVKRLRREYDQRFEKLATRQAAVSEADGR